MVVLDQSENFCTGDLVVAASDSMTSPDEKKPIPRRNLSQAFEALCVDTSTPGATGNKSKERSSDSQTPKKEGSSIFSPTSVTDPISEPILSLKSYEFNLHPELSRELSPALISRVSFYAIIHDINKEAASMAANDPSNKEETTEEMSPLVQAVTGATNILEGPEVKNAMIDEETWLLDAIQKRTADERATSTVCPPTFLQAMGEKEYENPVHALSGASRTQLWKPSRSWWEAKSGKNPWIEPNSHNKRWRYLWPFIHYHKFLAKCIKKLKRNGVDVKHSVSPVAVFLREEVCSISDHLASVSLFGSEEWMACLKHFHGWTDDGSEELLLSHIRQLKLRPLNEPGDVDSPLLRSQIDEHFLKAMAAQREQLREVPNNAEAPKPPKTKGQPPMYPRGSSITSHSSGPQATTPVPSQIHPHSGIRRQHFQHPFHGPQYWGWEQQMIYGDNASVQSTLTNESSYGSYPEYSNAPYQHYFGAGHPHYTHNQVPYPYESNDVYHQPQNAHGWLDPALAPYSMQPPLYYSDVHSITPPCPQDVNNAEKEEKEDPPTREGSPQIRTSPQHQHSPFWSHLVDGATQSLNTPAKSSPSTPLRSAHHKDGFPTEEHHRLQMNAQPLLLPGYYGYGHFGARDGYAPPSPATQFMMPPQNNSYYYGYAYSPGRTGRTPRKQSPPNKVKATNAQGQSAVGPMEPRSPVRKVVDIARGSPATVETTLESESLNDQEAPAS